MGWRIRACRKAAVARQVWQESLLVGGIEGGPRRTLWQRVEERALQLMYQASKPDSSARTAERSEVDAERAANR